ncbi:MAG: demethylmenaquinone methyltransferase [Candidatus Nanopelagicales bacterium]
MTRADLNKQPRQVASMFDQVAARYDLTNDVLAFGQTASWRRATVRALEPNPGDKILDLAAGTGSSTKPFDELGAFAIPCDFSIGMLTEGRKRLPNLPFVAGDAMALPFADATFDAVTISFGLRNVVDTEGALREMRRVTRPGGRLVICEFSQPSNDVFRTVYLEYLMKYLPVVAEKVASNPEAYVYLAESIREWPAQDGLSHILSRAGWVDVQWRNLTGGIVALHRAIRL